MSAEFSNIERSNPLVLIGGGRMGAAMLSVGMVASFLTKNLTVGFILGAVFNAPLALANYVDVIISDAGMAQSIGQWGMSSKFQDFGRGVVSLSAATYFTVIVACGVYFSVVLIGRRHWLGGSDGTSMSFTKPSRVAMILKGLISR